MESAPLPPEFAPLLEAAIRAPSGDNTQPWRIHIDRDVGEILLELDETRDTSPMNAGQRMARIALGAAMENLIRVAEERGWTTDVSEAVDPMWSSVRLAGAGRLTSGREERVIHLRATNRRTYERRGLPSALLERLRQETHEVDGVSTHWVVGTERLASLARIIGRADATMLGEYAMRNAFLDKVRLDAPARENVAEGLSLGSIEASRLDRFALHLMRWSPDRLLKLAGVPFALEQKARRLVLSASGMCLITARDGSRRTDIAVGRSMQRAWLALTRYHLAAQPMMSLPVLENFLEHEESHLNVAIPLGRIRDLGEAFRDLFPEVRGGRPAFLMRFGYAPPPSGRTGRLPLEKVVVGANGRTADDRA